MTLTAGVDAVLATDKAVLILKSGDLQGLAFCGTPFAFLMEDSSPMEFADRPT